MHSATVGQKNSLFGLCKFANSLYALKALQTKAKGEVKIPEGQTSAQHIILYNT